VLSENAIAKNKMSIEYLSLYTLNTNQNFPAWSLEHLIYCVVNGASTLPNSTKKKEAHKKESVTQES